VDQSGTGSADVFQLLRSTEAKIGSLTVVLELRLGGVPSGGGVVFERVGGGQGVAGGGGGGAGAFGAGGDGGSVDTSAVAAPAELLGWLAGINPQLAEFDEASDPDQ
jgi:hypothetical protein